MPITSTGAWTKNYEAIKRYWAANISPVSSQSFGSILNEAGVALYYVDREYNTAKLPIAYLTSGTYQTDSSNGRTIMLVLGGEQSGGTPSETDYAIWGPIRNTSGENYLSYRNVTNTPLTPGLDGDGNYVSGMRSSVTIQNMADNAITVYEYGLFTGLRATTTNSSSSSAYSSHQVLLYRGVLSEPVTLGRWDTITINLDRYIKVALQESGTTP